MDPKITVVTASIGRPSIALVADDISNQTFKDFRWLVLFDGREASVVGKQYLPKFAQVHIHEPAAKMEPFEVILPNLDLITTPYVCFMDDDNRFGPKHLQFLVEALDSGKEFVATSRIYTDEDMIPRITEHGRSEHFDTNNMAMPTNLLREIRQHWKKNFKTPNLPFQDRHVCAYVFSTGRLAHRIPDSYTVSYKVNPKRMNLDKFPGDVMYETLGGQCFSFSRPTRSSSSGGEQPGNVDDSERRG